MKDFIKEFKEELEFVGILLASIMAIFLTLTLVLKLIN